LGRLLFENIYDYFNSANIKESNEALYNDVEALYILYIELYNNEDEDITETQFNNIKAKIRQQLQILRDKDYLKFTSRGKYILR